MLQGCWTAIEMIHSIYPAVLLTPSSACQIDQEILTTISLTQKNYSAAAASLLIALYLSIFGGNLWTACYLQGCRLRRKLINDCSSLCNKFLPDPRKYSYPESPFHTQLCRLRLLANVHTAICAGNMVVFNHQTYKELISPATAIRAAGGRNPLFSPSGNTCWAAVASGAERALCGRRRPN